MIDRIVRLPLRETWRYEDKNFTTWLESNIDILKDVIGIEIFNAQREQNTGSFNVDIVGEDSSGNTIVIENQLEKSDHTHLGQLITYLTAFEAKIAIWIVSEPRLEHINAVSWLNESTEVDFYLIKLEAIRIGNSPTAPLMTQIVGPSEEARKIGVSRKEKSELHKLRYKFWEGLLEKSRTKHHLFNSISPTSYNWIGVSTGLRGVNYSFWLNKENISIKIYIDRGKDSDEENLKIFNDLIAHKDEIESVFGEELIWEELENYRSCVIKKDYQIGGWGSNEEKWEEIQEFITGKMMQLELASKDFIKGIKI